MAVRRAKKKTKRKARKKANAKRKPGRPEIVWDLKLWRRFELICSVQRASQAEIADAMDADIKTVDAICKRTVGLSFSAYRRQKKGSSLVQLEGKQYQVAMTDGHRSQGTMLVWLGKQWLGQKEPPRDFGISAPDGGPVKVEHGISDEQADAIKRQVFGMRDDSER